MGCDVVTLGETMLRLSAPGHGRLEEAVTLEVRVGGSESNTAVALARLGVRTSWLSRLPDNPLGHRIENEIRRWGVDTTGVIWDRQPGARAGLYFIDFGTAPRGIDVTYDRAESAMSRLRPDEIDAAAITNARLLHLSGITPALSASCAEAVAQAIAIARKAGLKISFDVNYRARLWTPDEARATLTPLLKGVDLLLIPQADAELLFGVTQIGIEAARSLRDRFEVGTVVMTLGGGGALAYDDQGDCSAAPHTIGQVVDRVGAGDAFGAGVLMGFLQNDLALGLDYGAAMAALKHTIPGDLLLATRAEIETARSGAHNAIRR